MVTLAKKVVLFFFLNLLRIIEYTNKLCWPDYAGRSIAELLLLWSFSVTNVKPEGQI